MTQHTKILLPKLGESILSATVVQWYKKLGDTIIKDEPLLEVNTDKVASEIPSPVSGILVEIHAGDGVELQVGELLASISTSLAIHPPQLNPFLTPAVLRLLQEKKIPLADIDKLPHSGDGGRLTKQDVEGYCPLKLPLTNGVERIKMSPMRKAIADNMVKSFYQAPHASLVTEIDVTNLMKFIATKKESFQAEHGAKLTITSFVAAGIVKALQSYPLLNSSIEGDIILQKKSINLGLAVGVEDGVMVPVIRNSETLDISQIAKAITSFADKARNQSLTPADTHEGSITLTNFGMTGTLIGIPILRFPEVAIIGLGAITRKVVPMKDDSIAIRSMAMISLTFDHRVVDGLYGCGFLEALKKNLEQDLII